MTIPFYGKTPHLLSMAQWVRSKFIRSQRTAELSRVPVHVPVLPLQNVAQAGTLRSSRSKNSQVAGFLSGWYLMDISRYVLQTLSFWSPNQLLCHQSWVVHSISQPYLEMWTSQIWGDPSNTWLKFTWVVWKRGHTMTHTPHLSEQSQIMTSCHIQPKYWLHWCVSQVPSLQPIYPLNPLAIKHGYLTKSYRNGGLWLGKSSIAKISWGFSRLPHDWLLDGNGISTMGFGLIPMFFL